MQSDSVPKYINFAETLYKDNIFRIMLNGASVELISISLSVLGSMPQYAETASIEYPQDSLTVRRAI